jgi:hypothetical protein
MIPSLPVFSKSDGAVCQLQYLEIAFSNDDQALTDPRFKDEPLWVSQTLTLLTVDLHLRD